MVSGLSCFRRLGRPPDGCARAPETCWGWRIDAARASWINDSREEAQSSSSTPSIRRWWLRPRNGVGSVELEAPGAGWEALQSAVADWQSGRTSWEGWGEQTDAARVVFARLVGVEVEHVAVGSTVSELVGSVITALPAGARVVVPDIEFTSTLFPLLVQSRLDVRTVPPGQLADAVAEGVEAVAFSAVQMSTGEVADLRAILDAAEDVGAVTVCDATQALGWLPIQAGRFDALVCAAYKWLMSPRGSAFLPYPSTC
jgi:selenocysteine lyase/cysteine desulfurase